MNSLTVGTGSVPGVDLNCDLGEGFGIWPLGDDDALLEIVTSANVACGFHAGDPSTMRRVCEVARARRVAVGAQVGYRDLAGFGRRRIDYDPGELRDDLTYQIGALSAFGPVRYVKPHGALYLAAAVDAAQAGAVVAAARAAAVVAAARGGPVVDAAPAGSVDATRAGAVVAAARAGSVAGAAGGLPVLCQPGSTLAHLAAGSGLRVVAEGFADRAYLPDGQLMPRNRPGAVLDPDAAVAQAVRFALDGSVVTADGSVLAHPVDSICVHGDTPAAVELARRVRAELERRGVTVAAWPD